MTTKTPSNWLPHALELRKRLLKSAFAYLLIVIPFLIYANDLYDVMVQFLQPHNTLLATQITSTFLVPLKLAFLAALVPWVPYLFYQLWAFITPALYPKEKKMTLLFAFTSCLLFYTGIAFALGLVIPTALLFFQKIAPSSVTVAPDILHLSQFICNLTLIFGCAFQIPIVTFLLLRWKIVRYEQLTKHRGFIVLAAFILGMLLTPPDVISQIFLAIPLILLFESGLWCYKIAHRKKKAARIKIPIDEASSE